MRTSPSPAQDSRDQVEEAGAIPAIPGIPWWGAAILALVLTIIGVVVDKFISVGPAWGLRSGFFLGAVLAALLVRRRAVFTAMVQPPLVLVIVLVPALKVLFANSFYEAAVHLVNTFPTMAIGTVLALIIGVIRLFAQPLKSKSQRPAAAQSARHA
ncbi:hypothetical protein GIS00_02755 [Nakamurella sp. YIM 132087]|uniref:DUF6542 domain-containing protein n=1 Tax=Nakamurella alba TaxID=2665158 RepID=A0A7K1FFH1_9ACTN|nr:DUF6542 domain-containing protein [Nakamurella alba]MTD12865.1 hypothetical protein [Nakamurella alba]